MIYIIRIMWHIFDAAYFLYAELHINQCEVSCQEVFHIRAPINFVAFQDSSSSGSCLWIVYHHLFFSQVVDIYAYQIISLWIFSWSQENSIFFGVLLHVDKEKRKNILMQSKFDNVSILEWDSLIITSLLHVLNKVNTWWIFPCICHRRFDFCSNTTMSHIGVQNLWIMVDNTIFHIQQHFPNMFIWKALPQLCIVKKKKNIENVSDIHRCSDHVTVSWNRLKWIFYNDLTEYGRVNLHSSVVTALKPNA